MRKRGASLFIRRKFNSLGRPVTSAKILINPPELISSSADEDRQDRAGAENNFPS